MWIKAQDGRLVNLSLYSTIEIDQVGSTSDFNVMARGDNNIKLMKFDAKSKAEEFVAELYKNLPRVMFNLEEWSKK